MDVPDEEENIVQKGPKIKNYKTKNLRHVCPLPHGQNRLGSSHTIVCNKNLFDDTVTSTRFDIVFDGCSARDDSGIVNSGHVESRILLNDFSNIVQRVGGCSFRKESSVYCKRD